MYECNFTTYNNGEFANHKLRMHPPDDYIEKSGFNRKCVNIIFEIKEETSPLEVLENYRGKVRKILKQQLEENKNIKSYITMKIRMYKFNQEGEKIQTDAGFNGGIGCLLSENDIDEFYEVSRENIMEDFETFNENASGWIFERV